MHVIIKYFLLVTIGLPAFSFAQGIINNGGSIVFSGAAHIYVAGGTNGNYLSQAGGIVYPSPTGNIWIEGDWTNNSANTGFFSDDGTVNMNGANESINGTNSTTFNNLTLLGSGVKTQNLNTNVGGVVTTNGVLSVGNVIYDLNSNILTITNPVAAAVTFGAGYILSETNAAVNPSIMRWNMAANVGAHVYPFGVAGTQIPFTFNKTTAGISNIDVSTRATAASDNVPWAGASNVGGVTFFYCPNNAMAGNPCATNSVIDRWWDITPSAAVTANCTFSYRGSENTLNVPYNTGNIGAQWWDGTAWNLNNATTGSAAAVLAGVGSVTAPGLNQFCPYVLSSVAIPLPIDLIDFSAMCDGENNVVLNWSSASEKNSAYFDIMNSKDGFTFTKIASVSSKGNSAAINHYSFMVENKKSLGNYFRLKMVDSDLTYRNSKTEYVSDDCNMTEEKPNLYYNQHNGIVITSTNKDATNYKLNIIDAAGRLIRTESLPIHTGYNNITISTELAAGVYLVNLTYNNGQMISKKIPVY
ncbi:MAG: T9SS type A sorting domain-containing protein [Bacteroidetes bacterium]|nr:T9SS type A sorting domain-containing protein [Bacteroidota bacterium]